jgi:hypothetical protein
MSRNADFRPQAGLRNDGFLQHPPVFGGDFEEFYGRISIVEKRFESPVAAR